MSPLPILRRGFAPLLLIVLSLIFSAVHAQTDEDLQKMGKNGDGFQFHLKFRGNAPATIPDATYATITALLEKYKGQVGTDLQSPFKVQGEAAGQKPNLSPEQQTALKNQAAAFFHEMSSKKLTLWDLQQYKDNFRNKNPRPGDNPIDPKIAWKGEFEGIERTLMGGRTLLVMDVWKQTMIDFFNTNPEAVGVVYGQMDIGSWVKMNVDGLGFAADIDFSTVATDAKTNQALHKLFGDNLKNATGLNMIAIDVVHTSHGLAGAEVFIGEWGKAFAEVDMLRRGKWKLLEVERNENGQVVKLNVVEKEGRELFMEKGIEQEMKAQKKDPTGSFDPKEKYPELRIDMEPMLSLEMLRHAIHDIEHGPFEGGQKIIKMIKYTERSFFMINEALKNIPVKEQMLYFNLTPDEQKLMTLSETIIQNKGDAKKIAGLLEEFTGKKLESNEQVNLIVDDIVQKCKKAMLKNANQSFGYRIRKIAEIEDENQRFEEADKFLKQIDEELNKGYKASDTDVPKSMLRAKTILIDLRAGKIPADQVNAKLEELNRIMEQDFRVDKSFVERIIGDTWGAIRKYMVEKGYGPEAIQKMVDKVKNMFVENWKYYAPELAQRSTLTAYEYASHVRNKMNAFNEHLAKTKTGKVLGSELLNHIDNTVALYDAWMSGKDLKQSAWRVSWTAGTIWAQGRWPFLAIPLGIYNSLETKSIGPAAMATAFYLFPMAGQAYMVTNLIDRLVVSNVRDYDFRNHLDRLAVMAQTDGQGHVIRFKIPRAFTGLTGSPDSLETDPDIPVTEPGRTTAIKEVFYSDEFMYSPDIKYFNSLIPKKYDQFGLYDSKLKNLISLFSFDNDFAGYLIGVEKFKKDKDNNELPSDDFEADRTKMLDSLENGIEDHLWAAVFSAIESIKRGEKAGALQEMEAIIVRIQDSLFLGDWNMKKIDSLSLLLKIRKQVQNDPFYKQALKDKFSAGTAYDRVAIPLMERYIQVYRQIIVIQSKIFEIWRPFGADASKLQSKPYRLLLQGGLTGAPLLSTDPDKDMQAAIRCLEAHTKRSNKIRMDLSDALGRPINPQTDKDHLRILGELGFGAERLVDGYSKGRSPLYPDENDAVETQLNEMNRAYNDYLSRLKEGPALDLTLKIEAENSTTETNPVTAKVSITDNKTKKVISLPANTSMEWWLYDEDTRKEVKVADGATCTNDASKKGGFTYSVRLVKKMNNKTTVVASTNWYLEVKRFDASSPTKGILIKAPDVIKQYDLFDVTLNVPAALKGRQLKCNWGYLVLGKNDDCSGAKMQYYNEIKFTGKDGKQYLADSTTVEAYVTVMIPGKTYGEVYQVSKKVKFQHMSINVRASDIWEGGSGPNWFRIDRKPISNPPRYADWMNDPTRRARSTATAYATVGLKDDDPFETINTLEDLKALMDKKAKEQAYRKLEVKAVSVGDFKGYGLYSNPRYSRGSWSFEGYTSAGAGASFSGYVMKGKKIFEVYWNAGAGGAFDNSDQGWMMSMVNLLAAEAESILTSASFQPDGRLTKTPYTGPKLDGSDFPQVSIEPKVDTVLPGSKVTVKAVIKNDKPEYGPYTFSWSGNVDAAAAGSSVQLESDRPGKKTITVNVGGTIPPGTASMEYVVAPLKVKITKISPPAPTIIVGMPVELRADFTGPVPAGKKLQYLWQPHPEEKFEPFEGTGNTTKVVFTKPGNKKVWVQVLDKTTAETITMGESDQLEFVVEKPAFTIGFTPAKARVGEMVVAKISSQPDKLEEVSYRWMPLPANATLLKESQDGSEITFYAKDALQIPFEVLSLVKGSGEELGRTKGYFSAERYVVKAEGPKVQGPKPMIWKPGVGLVEVDKEIAVHQIVEFNTVVTPTPATDLTYNWQVMEGNASVSNPTSRDARVTALETGTITLRVTVKDKNGIELGNATGTFSASISQEMISNANNQKKLFDEKMKQARQLLNEGKLDEAVKLGLELKDMNAKDAAPLLGELGTACKKEATAAATERDFEKAIKRCNQAIELNPNDTAAKKQLEEMKKWAQEWSAVNAKGDALEGSITAKDLPAAEKLLNELVKLQEKMPGQSANKWTAEKQKKYAALLNSCDSAFTEARNRFNQLYQGKDYEKALQELQSFMAAWKPLSSTVMQIQNVTGPCKDAISNQKKVYADFQQIKSRFEQGQAADPLKGPDYIEATANNTFGKQDPRLKEMTDFARVMKNKQNENNSVKARAEKLKAEGQAAEEADDTETAIRKYRESIALVPDPELEAYIRILETKEIKPPGNPEVINGNWSTQAHEYRQNVGKQYTYYFPPGGNLNGGCWGTDTYTTDGSIAKAAVHAGLITVKEGGTVTIEIRPGQESYTGSTRNGVTSNSWGSFYASFVFVDKKNNTDIGETGGLQLVAYYPFNGNANDASGKNRHGTLHNGVTLTKDRFDKENSAFYFDGTDDYIDFSASGLPAKDRTVMFWLKPAPGNQPSYPLTYGGGSQCGYSFLMGFNAEGSKRFNTQGHCRTNSLYNDPWIMDPSNQWRHFTVTIKGNSIKIYLNGVLMKSNTGFTNPTGVEGKKLIIGGLVGPEGITPYRDASGGYFKGVLDDIRIYSGAMTDEQVRAAVAEEEPGKVNEPVKEDKGVKPADPEKEKKVFDNGNIGGVSSGPPNPTKITFSTPVFITRIENYHYFNGGKKPGTIGLRHSDGTMYGPWQAFGLIGQGGVQNASWDVLPNIEVPAGTYTVIDSDPSTWSYNSQSGGCGFTNVWTDKTRPVNETTPPDKGVNPADPKKEKKIFDNGNIGGVSSGPPNPTKITFTTATFITRIENYHYFNRGTKPGTIGLRHSNGTMYGPWQAYGLVGQGGVQNASWDVLPNIEVPAGTYTVIDSDPSTWSYNSQSGGCGFTMVWTSNTPVKPVTTVPDKGVNPADPNKEDKIFTNGNIGGVSSGPPNPTKITFTTATFITRIENYHYFNRGTKPGTIGLRHNNGTMYGPWQAYGLVGQGGVQNASWDVLPNIEVPAGTYTVIDSDPSTWSYNSESGGCGFTTVWTAKKGTTPVKPGYTIEEVGGGVTAEQICIAGDIDNLGFGFPKGFDVFSGNSTPSHGYPWKIDPNDAMGTDRIMVGSGAKGNSDGYSGTTKRPDNMPVPVTLGCNVTGISIRAAVLQLFVDDFQAPSFGSVFTATLNGRRAPFLESVLNSLRQTGPIGKLISVNIPAEFFNEVKSGQLKLFIDDATSGRGDGFAIDFVRLIINPSSYAYTGTITGMVFRPDGQPAAGAVISAGGIINTTASSTGEFTLKNVPAGMVTIQASYNNHHHTSINTDLASGKTIKLTINLPAD